MADTSQTAPSNSPKSNNKLYDSGKYGKFDASTYDISQYTYPDDLYSNKGQYGGNYWTQTGSLTCNLRF